MSTLTKLSPWITTTVPLGLGGSLSIPSSHVQAGNVAALHPFRGLMSLQTEQQLRLLQELQSGALHGISSSLHIFARGYWHMPIPAWFEFSSLSPTLCGPKSELCWHHRPLNAISQCNWNSTPGWALQGGKKRLWTGEYERVKICVTVPVCSCDAWHPWEHGFWGGQSLMVCFV